MYGSQDRSPFDRRPFRWYSWMVLSEVVTRSLGLARLKILSRPFPIEIDIGFVINRELLC